MSKKNRNEEAAPVAKEAKKKKKKGSGTMGRVIRRFFLVLFTLVILLVAALALVMNLIFNGPSPAARDVLTMSLTEASATKWVPGLFMDQATVEAIRANVQADLPSDVTNTNMVVIKNDPLSAPSDEWADYPDGIRFEEVSGKTYNAHVMIVKDPSQVYMATSTEEFSYNIPGTRITDQIETEGAIAAVNAGAFFDDGTAGPKVGSVPLGLVYSEGECVWQWGTPNENGFAGFNEDNILVVATDPTKAQTDEWGIRDGCGFGPVLIIDGNVNQEAYNSNSGYNPRTAIGQRADGAVIFLCIDGRQASSMGGTYADIIDIMVEFGAVNACNMDGGSSSVMLYRDTYGRYGTAGEVKMMNNYSLLQSQPRKMPNFWMVRPAN